MSTNENTPDPRNWDTVIASFAEAIGRDKAEIESALKSLVGDPGESALALLSSEGDTPLDELTAVIKGVPTAVFRKAVRDHLREDDDDAESGQQAGSEARILTSGGIEILPNIPGDDAWLSALKAGGVQKVSTAVLMSGIRAALASSAGLFGLPKNLRDAMERHAATLAEPVGEEYFQVDNLLVSVANARVVNAITGNRKFATRRRREQLMKKMQLTLLPGLVDFHKTLTGWTESWQNGMNGPGLLVAFMATNQGNGGALPPNALAPPEASGVRAAAESVVELVNKTFAGLGIPIANAMAIEAAEIIKILEEPKLPALVGAANREQMLKALSVGVDADYVRLEQNLVRYVTSVMQLNAVAADQEAGYLTSLYMLGQQIPWARTSSQGTTTVMASIEDMSDDDEDEFHDDDEDEQPRRLTSNSGNGRWTD